MGEECEDRLEVAEEWAVRFMALRKLQFCGRVPKQLFEIDDLVVFDTDPLFFQQLLHPFGGIIMMPARQQSIAIDHPMGGDGVWGGVGAQHSPSYHSCRQAGAQTGWDGAIGGYPARGDLAGYFMNQVKEGVVLLAGRAEDGEFFAAGFCSG